MMKYPTLLLLSLWTLSTFGQAWTYNYHGAEFDQIVGFGLASSPPISVDVVNANGSQVAAQLKLELGKFDNDCSLFAQISGSGLTTAAEVSQITFYTEIDGAFVRREYPANQASMGAAVTYNVNLLSQDLFHGSRCKVVTYNNQGGRSFAAIFSLRGSSSTITQLKGDCQED